MDNQGASILVRRSVPAWCFALLGLAALLLAVLAFQVDPADYFRVLGWIMMGATASPFFDAVQIPALVECHRLGVDVYVSAVCDPGLRPLAYSPLWLRATFLPADLGWLDALGLALSAMFCLSLSFLPPLRSRTDAGLFALALFSSMPVFALERGNMDVAMFALIALGGWCWQRGVPARGAGYAVFTLAGLLKFYPLVLFLLFLRESWPRFVLLCALGFSVLCGFVWWFFPELQEMVRNLPTLGLFTDTFGARQLPAGIGLALGELLVTMGFDPAGLPRSLEHDGLVALGLTGFLWIAAIGIAIDLAQRPGFRTGFAALSAAESGFLVIGAVLVCGCFFVGQNVCYRGIHFLFVIPGLAGLAAEARSTRLVLGMTLALTLVLMWGLTIQQLLADVSGGTYHPIGGSAVMYLYWIVHELVWWWVVAVLLAILLCFVRSSAVWSTIERMAPRKA
jgi:hypothetical protein